MARCHTLLQLLNYLLSNLCAVSSDSCLHEHALRRTLNATTAEIIVLHNATLAHCDAIYRSGRSRAECRFRVVDIRIMYVALSRSMPIYCHFVSCSLLPLSTKPCTSQPCLRQPEPALRPSPYYIWTPCRRSHRSSRRPNRDR